MYKTPTSKSSKRLARARSHSLSPHGNRGSQKMLAQKSKGELDLPTGNVQKPSRSLVRIKSQIFSDDDSFPHLTNSIANALNLSECKSDDLTAQLDVQSMTHIPALPEKIARSLSLKRREFIYKRKALVALQNTLMEQLAAIKDIETRIGIPHDDRVDKLPILTLANWPPHDLLLLIKDMKESSVCSEISSFLGSKVLCKVTEQLRPVHEEVLAICNELLNSLKQISLRAVPSQHRCNKPTRQFQAKTKSSASLPNLDIATLSGLVENLGEKIKSRIEMALRLMKLPWLDRDTLIKKLELLQRELFIAKHKTEENQTECEDEAAPMDAPQQDKENTQEKKQSLCDLEKYRTAMESMKEMVASAENMVRVARARIAILEKELKIARAEVDTLRRKHKENEQYIRQRENAYESRLKKLVEHSKNGETAVEALTRQRDALEIRVKELRDQADKAEKKIKERNLEVMHVKAMEHHTDASLTMKCVQLEKQVADLQTQLKNLREQSDKLVQVTKQKCLEYVPVRDDLSLEKSPTPVEVDIYMELKSTRMNLKSVEENLQKSRADKEALLKSLYEIARGEGEEKETKLAEELVNREKRIGDLQSVIEDQRHQLSKKDQVQADLRNTIQALRIELIKARSYDTYTSNDFPSLGIQEEIIELYTRCESMTRERAQLLSTAAARSLMLERYERAADMFAQIVNARQTLTDALHGKPSVVPANLTLREVSQSLTALCENAVETWNALCNERTKVHRLESELANRNHQLEREAKVRTHLERRRAALVRALMVNPTSAGVDTPLTKTNPKANKPSRSPEKKKYLARIGSLFKF